jgi:hypothetical protein
VDGSPPLTENRIFRNPLATWEKLSPALCRPLYSSRSNMRTTHVAAVACLLIVPFVSTRSADSQTFWAPRVPPRAEYRVDVTYSSISDRLEGRETIAFRNETSSPITRLAFRWYGDVLDVRSSGMPATRVGAADSAALFELPSPVDSGQSVSLTVAFGASLTLDAKSASAIVSYVSPQLWWGFGTHDDYEVAVHVPPGYTVATSGRQESSSEYRARDVRTFGLFIGRDYGDTAIDVDGVHIRAVFTAAGRPCADLLLKTAADAVRYYCQRLGLYPQTALTIVPGADQPNGGYPVATGLVVVHGQERLSARPESFWRWITAHEVGHQYWSEYVLAQGADSLSSLMLGLGLHTDRGYRLARGITTSGSLEQNYIQGVEDGYDAPLDLAPEARAEIHWNVGTIIDHGKSAAFMNALESVIGADALLNVERECLKNYAGIQLGWSEFQHTVERESGQELGWLFDQWVRGLKTVNYRVAGHVCNGSDRALTCSIRVERTGTLRMPITIAARFEDGSEQRGRTDRLADISELVFRAGAPLKEVLLDPDGLIAMTDPPSETERALRLKIQALGSTGDTAAAVELHEQAQRMHLTYPASVITLALALYDGRHYEQALDEFGRLEQSQNLGWRFDALVWEGHLFDVLGNRAEAIKRYNTALAMPGTPSIRHDQYQMVINKEWAAKRLEAPFSR